MKTVIFLDKNATVDRLFIVCGPRGSVAEPQGMSDRHVTNIIYVLCICISTKKEKKITWNTDTCHPSWEQVVKRPRRPDTAHAARLSSDLRCISLFGCLCSNLDPWIRAEESGFTEHAAAMTQTQTR
jgi:hypothetical protein